MKPCGGQSKFQGSRQAVWILTIFPKVSQQTKPSLRLPFSLQPASQSIKPEQRAREASQTFEIPSVALVVIACYFLVLITISTHPLPAKNNVGSDFVRITSFDAIHGIPDTAVQKHTQQQQYHRHPPFSTIHQFFASAYRTSAWTWKRIIASITITLQFRCQDNSADHRRNHLCLGLGYILVTCQRNMWFEMSEALVTALLAQGAYYTRVLRSP